MDTVNESDQDGRDDVSDDDVSVAADAPDESDRYAIVASP